MEYIVLIPNSIKKNIIKEVRNKYYNYNIKFLSLEEFIEKYTFSYNNKTIYYLMREYNLNLSSAMVYIKNLYYIDMNIHNKKMDTLINMKKFLDDNNLLIYDKYFKEYVKNKEIYIYGYDYLNKYYLKVLEGLNYKVIDYVYNDYEVKNIYEFNYIDEEVIFVIDKILELIRNNIKPENIKLIISKEYEEIIDRLFKIYNIPINVKKRSIYSARSVKEFLNNLDDINKGLDDINDDEIRNKVISVLNNYAFIDNKKEALELIINDLKNTYFEDGNTSVKIARLDDYFTDDDYVFLLGFNKENIPILYKDDEYFSDKEKEEIGYDSSNTLNINKKIEVIKKIKNIKNIIISYKLYDANNIYTRSDLFSDVNIIKDYKHLYTNSDMMNKIFLAGMLDDLVKYDVINDDINLLISNYHIPYMEYDNSYHTIDKNKLYKYLNNKLLLSYTSLNNYYKCKFKYYLNHVLKINIIRDDFAILVGEVCHYILSCIDNDDFDIDTLFDNYLKTKREFSKREMFFLNNIKEEIVFIVATIRKQMTYTTFDKSMKEKCVYVNKDRNIKVTFKGVIDKVLYKEEDDITYLVVIDYKTGTAGIDIKNMEYGLGMQLPIYLYLSSKIGLKDVKVVGFYLQKLFNTSLDNSKDYLEEKESKLKLDGYSINNENILSKFDTTYHDSKLIKSMKTTNNGFYKYSKVLTGEEMDEMAILADNMIDKVIDGILDCDFDINPKVINGSNESCKLCEYRDICYQREKDIVYINKEVKDDGEV